MLPEEFKKKIKQKEEKLIFNIKDKASNKNIKFSIYNNATLWRANTLFEKEPVTIEWIRNFEPNSIFFDVGANVGVFSIFAALVSESIVYSFEPEANNFLLLMENSLINDLSNKINAYQVGISDNDTFTNLYLSEFDKGRSHHMVGEELDPDLKKTDKIIKQGIFSTSLDKLMNVWSFPAPNYLKIDVDGIEYKIIDGAKKLLLNKDLKSILIEINPLRTQDKKIIDILENCGFKYDKKQVNLAKRKNGDHKGYAEYLFYR